MTRCHSGGWPRGCVPVRCRNTPPLWDSAGLEGFLHALASSPVNSETSATGFTLLVHSCVLAHMHIHRAAGICRGLQCAWLAASAVTLPVTAQGRTGTVASGGCGLGRRVCPALRWLACELSAATHTLVRLRREVTGPATRARCSRCGVVLCVCHYHRTVGI